MAKVKIQGHASGTGILTVTAPNTSTDRTITLPDASGTLLNSDGSGASLTALPAAQLTGALPAISGASLTGFTDAQMPAGAVLQVVQTVYEGSLSSTSNTLAATGLSCTITPTSSSSKILITVTGGGQTCNGSDVGALNSIMRSINSGTVTNLAESGTDMQINYQSGTVNYMVTPHAMQKLDSPNTALSTEYFHYFATRDSGNDSRSNFLGGEVNMILMEIAG
jgi:hypothetical protein